MIKYLKISLTLLFFLPLTVQASENIKTVQATGACAIEGYTATDAKQLALQQARKNAIETANGSYIQSYSVVNSGALALDLINTFTSGFITKEEARWSSKFYDHDNDVSTAEIPEYKVTLLATVKQVIKQNDFVFLADLNKQVYTHGEAASLTLTSPIDVQIAIFYYGNNDKIYKIFPSASDNQLILEKQKQHFWPPEDSDQKLVMEVAQQQQETSEALIVLAIPATVKNFDFNKRFVKDVYEFTDFFRTYSEIAYLCNERILPYRVFLKNKKMNEGL